MVANTVEKVGYRNRKKVVECRIARYIHIYIYINIYVCLYAYV
jgi:hypothetical protein